MRELKAAAVTQVIVAHRPQVLAGADKILVLKDGRAVLYGSASEVLAKMAGPHRANAQTEVAA